LLRTVQRQREDGRVEFFVPQLVEQGVLIELEVDRLGFAA